MEVSKYTCCLFLVKFLSTIFHVQGSGSLYDPPNRAVMWKYGFNTQKNYNYMQLNCGGEKQPENGPWKCGICGDPYDQSLDHEKGGKYGSLIISRYYPAGIKEMSVKIELLAFEKGFFEFRICAANNNTVTQECLDENILPIKEGYLAGTPLRFYPKGAGDFRLTVAIPPDLSCERCVLQWRYHTANSWGTDPVTQKQGLGFGPQEEFRNCADVRIGGTIPKSVRENPFFAPPDQMTSSSIDRPTEQRKKLASSNGTFVTSPEGADQFSPAIRAFLQGVNGLRETVESRSGNISSGSINNISGFVEGKLNVQTLPDVHTSGKGLSNVQITEEKRQERTRMNLMPNFVSTSGGSLHGSMLSDLAANDINAKTLDNVLTSHGDSRQDTSAGMIHIGGLQTEMGSQQSARTDNFGDQMVGNSGTVDIFNGQGQVSGGVGFTGSTDVQIDGMGLMGNIDGSFVQGSDITGAIDSQRTLGSILTGNADRQKTTFTTEIKSQGSIVDDVTGGRIIDGSAVAKNVDSQMPVIDSLAETAETSFTKTSGLGGGIHVSSGKGSQLLGTEGSAVKTIQNTGGFERRMTGAIGGQTDAGTEAGQFTSTILLQEGHGDKTQHDTGLTNDIMHIAAGIVGMDKGGENLQAGSVLTKGSTEQHIITQDFTGQVPNSNDILPGKVTGGFITDSAFGTSMDMNIQSERNLGVLGPSGVVGPAPMPNKKSTIFVEGANIRKAGTGLQKGNMKAATRSGFALTGISDTVSSDFQQQMNNKDKSLRPLTTGLTFVDQSQQGMTALENVAANSNFDSGLSMSFSSDRDRKLPSSRQMGSTTSRVDGLAFPDQIVSDLTIDGTHSNAISDKFNVNLDNTENNLKEQLVQDIALNANANFRPREIIVDGQRIIANGNVSGAKATMSTHKNIASQQKPAGATVFNKIGTRSGTPVSGQPLTQPSGRQRIFLVRASRPQTVLLSNSAESSNSGMTISETVQPNTDFVSAPISTDKTNEAKLSKVKVEKTISIDAASTKRNTDTISSVDASVMPEPIVNSLNPSDKSSMMLNAMTASEVIDPLRTQSIRSNGTIAGEHEFLNSGQLSLTAERTDQNRNQNVDGGNQIVNEIDAFRNELVKSSLRQGGALAAEMSKRAKSESQVATTNAIKQSDASGLDGTSLLISNEVGGKSETAGLGETVNNLLNEAQKLLSTTADFTSSQTVNIEDATGSLGKEQTKNTNAKAVEEQSVPVSVSQSVVAEDTTHVLKEPLIHTHVAGGFERVVDTRRDGLKPLDVHRHSTEILNIEDLIGRPSQVHDLHGISTKTVKTGSEQTIKPEIQGASGVIAFGSTAHLTGAILGDSGSQIDTIMPNSPSTETVSIDQSQGATHQDNVGINEQNMINRRGQFDVIGSSSFTGLSSAATRNEQPAFRENVINTLTGKTFSESHGSGSLNGDSRSGAQGSSLLSDTIFSAHSDMSTSRAVGGSASDGVMSDTRSGDSLSGVRTANVLSDTFNDGMTAGVFGTSGRVGSLGSNIGIKTQPGGSLRGTMESAASILTNNMDTMTGNARISKVVDSDARPGGLVIKNMFDTGSTLDVPLGNTVSRTFDERLVVGSPERGRASAPATVDRFALAGSFPDTNIMTGTQRSSSLDLGQNIDSTLSSGIGGKVIDFSSSSQRPSSQSPDLLIGQRQVAGKLQGTNQQSLGSLSGPSNAIVSNHVLDLSNVMPRQTGDAVIDFSMRSNSAGESGNIGRVESVSASSERINRTVSVQRQRNISGARSGRRVIGGNNIVTTGRQAASVPSQRIDSAAERMNIEQQINAFNLQDIPSSPVIDAGVQMSGDGSMTAGFGPRGREVFGRQMEERRLMSREDRRRGMLRGNSGRRNEGRSEDVFRIVRDPRTGLEERIPIIGRFRTGERIDRLIVQGRDGRSDAGRTGPEYFLDMSGSSPERRMSVSTESSFRDRGTGSTGDRIIEIRDIRGGSSREGPSFAFGSGGMISSTESRVGGLRTDAVRSERDFGGERMGEVLDGRTMLSSTRDTGDRRMTSMPVMSPTIISSGGSVPSGRGSLGGSVSPGGGVPGGTMPAGGVVPGGSMSFGSVPGGSMPAGRGFLGGSMTPGGGFLGGSVPAAGGFPGGSMPAGGSFPGGSITPGGGFPGGSVPPGGGFPGGMPPFSGSFPMMGPGPGPMMGGVPMGSMPFDSGIGPRLGPGIGPTFGPGMEMGGGMPTFPSLGFGPGML